MLEILKATHEVAVPETADLMTTHALGELAISTRLLLETTGASKKVGFVFKSRRRQPAFPAVSYKLPAFQAERQADNTWAISTYLAKPYSKSRDVTMNHGSFVLRDYGSSPMIEVSKISRDYFAVPNAANGYNLTSPNTTSVTPLAVLNELIPAVQVLGQTFEPQRSMWVVE